MTRALGRGDAKLLREKRGKVETFGTKFQKNFSERGSEGGRKGRRWLTAELDLD